MACAGAQQSHLAVIDASDVRIRPGRPGDAEELSRLFHASVRQIASHYYSGEQVGAWSPEPPDPARFAARITDGRTFLVATDRKGSIVAYGDVEPNGHIDHLYCRPDAAGTGVAALIYDRLEHAARQTGIERLHVEASEPASRFFAKHGFGIVERNDFELAGVPIHNFRMEKIIS